jgi:hypothetical protein
MKKDLSRQTRGISHFLNLKQDFEGGADRLFDSLPHFFRIMYMDQPNPWVKQINRFDLLRLAVVSSELPKYQPTQIGEFKYKKIEPADKKSIIEIPLSDFFQTNILKTNTYEYTTHEFLLCLAYNGGIHMKPDAKDEEKSDYLYNNLFEKHADFIYIVVRSIAKVLIDIYDEFYAILSGDNNGHSPNRNFQPIIVTGGKMLDGIYYKRSFMQFPIREKNNKGIRFCITLKLLKENDAINSPVLWYGHRDNAQLQVGIFQCKKMLLIQAKKSRIVTLKIDVGELLDSYFLLEVCLYPDGKIVASINGTLKAAEELNESAHIIDGKVILGADLDGSTFGEFFEQMILIQSIDKFSVTRNLGLYALNKMNIQSQVLPYNLVKRNL